MSIVCRNEPLPENGLLKFDAILKKCDGRYLCNPVEMPDEYGHWRVDYEYDSSEGFKAHGEMWKTANAEIREVRKDQWWRKLSRRVFR